MSATVLVTGGGGFIGTWVLRALLARGIRAVAFDAHENPTRWQRLLGAHAAEIPFIKGSLLDRTFIRVGDERYRRDNGSFGLTTLRTRHVRPGSTGSGTLSS